LILVEPNDAGGWTVTGPTQVKALADLFDPEVDTDKRKRIREAIDQSRADLLSGGVSAARLATSTKLPLQLIEEELKSYAKDAKADECLVARRLEGNIVLFRDGTAPSSAIRPGASMPFIDRVRSLFARKGDNEKKIAETSKENLARSGKFSKPIVTELLPAMKFYPAEANHQKYYQQNPEHFEAFEKGSGRVSFQKQIWRDGQ